MSPSEALGIIRQSAKAGSIRIAITDPDQSLWCLGAVGGLEALVELLQSATSAQPVDGWWLPGQRSRRSGPRR